MTEIVTVRVKKSLKEKVRRYKIDVSKTVRYPITFTYLSVYTYKLVCVYVLM